MGKGIDAVLVAELWSPVGVGEPHLDGRFFRLLNLLLWSSDLLAVLGAFITCK